MELTILMPCLNEAETLEVCIQKARTYLEKSGVEGEILIADNGSTDGSQDIARRCGARVVDVAERGYGAALIGGCNAAQGKYVIMGDADDSYDFLHLDPFVEKLREGYDLVMGNRFKGGIEPGAMPPLHRYLGNPVLSFIGRLFYPSDIGDFHCGLRGYNRESILKLGLQTTGMEYASEMVVKATLYKLKITEVPTTLKKDGRSHAPHLRSFRDGWRHLKFLLMHSPNSGYSYDAVRLCIYNHRSQHDPVCRFYKDLRKELWLYPGGSEGDGEVHRRPCDLSRCDPAAHRYCCDNSGTGTVGQDFLWCSEPAADHASDDSGTDCNGCRRADDLWRILYWHPEHQAQIRGAL